jgi:glutamyl-tRNA synthetase
MSAGIVTRFAPSPTGFLHIGGARTALFNQLFARGRGGRMLLRIEDTDLERSTEAAKQAIVDGLAWLGLHWDDEVIYQSQRAGRHRGAVEDLLAAGRAYRCYATPAELEAMREEATKAGRPPRYDGRWRDRDPGEAPPGIAPAIRLRAETEGVTVIDDQVQGRVEIPNKDLDDLVLLRSDGSPTYMLAVVVDDHDMGVTHVIRGVDHLTNAARQIQIYRAFGWDVPVMAHIPLIHGPDGAKLSKRHGALGVEAYRAMGYLPEALRNYLVRLGWSHGDQEVFTQDEMERLFDLKQVGRSAARFDFDKLANLNGVYIRAADDRRLVAAIDDLAANAGDGGALAAALTPEVRERLLKAMPGLKERAKTLVELLDQAAFLWARRPIAPDEKAAALLDPAGRRRLGALAAAFDGVDDWRAAGIEAVVRRYADEEGAKLGQIAQPLRAALTGKSTSPGIFDVLEVLGKDESLGRIRDQAA